MTHPNYVLTRSLGFNAYHLFTASSASGLSDYLFELNRRYNTGFFQHMLEDVADLIGARILNISTETYEPAGVSVAILMADKGETGQTLPGGHSTLGHLDKSHLTIHTYQQLNRKSFSGQLRVDLDLGSCGDITPLCTIDYLLDNLLCDVVTIDYRMRGYDQNPHQNRDIASIAPITHISRKHLESYLTKEFIQEDIEFHHLRMMKLPAFFTTRKSITRKNITSKTTSSATDSATDLGQVRLALAQAVFSSKT